MYSVNGGLDLIKNALSLLVWLPVLSHSSKKGGYMELCKVDILLFFLVTLHLCAICVAQIAERDASKLRKPRSNFYEQTGVKSNAPNMTISTRKRVSIDVSLEHLSRMLGCANKKDRERNVKTRSRRRRHRRLRHDRFRTPPWHLLIATNFRDR